MKGWNVDVALAHCATVDIGTNLSIGTMGSMIQTDQQKPFIEKLTGIELSIDNEKAITLESAGATSPTKSTSNLVITRGSAERIAMLGERSNPLTIQPYIIDISFDDSMKSKWFDQFISQHHLSTLRSHAINKEFTVPKALIEGRLCEAQQDITEGWMNGLD